ncbi:MAG: efflux RND transporter periplasmic adaptor subunit [Thermodesulfobacteriota bacterium]|nr:efflux RND transporter periplasmic adaptor subunit [Thermodesulfobacteriota bacterium]
MTRRVRIRWIVVFFFVTALGIAIWHSTRPEPVEVIVKAVEEGTVERTVSNTRAGTVKACRRAKLSPSVGGQIAKLPIHEGDRVKAGHLLLELWNEDIAAQLKLAKKEAETSKARARATCLKADNAQREARRLVRLRREDSISEEREDRAVTDAKALAAECESAKASTLMSEARVDVARAELERTRLVAPFAGVVAEINGELNEYVTPSPPGIATPPAVDLVDDSCFYVEAPIDEVDAPDIDPGSDARISLDAFGDQHFAGKVRRIAPYVLDREKQARTVDVEVEFTRPEDVNRLLAGYSADVEIILEVHQETLRVPTEAVLDGKQVYVYLPETNVIEERALEPGISNWDFTEVASGLSAGELVVVNVDRAGVRNGAHAVLASED